MIYSVHTLAHLAMCKTQVVKWRTHGCRQSIKLTVSGSVKASMAFRISPSSSPSTKTFWMPFSNFSPGMRKKDFSPFTSFFWPSWGFPSAPAGSSTTQYCRLFRVVMFTTPTTLGGERRGKRRKWGIGEEEGGEEGEKEEEGEGERREGEKGGRGEGKGRGKDRPMLMS